MNTHYTYFLILAGSIAGPLALSFDKKVAFYRKWPAVFSAMLLPALFYIVWDVVFTHLNVWSFNTDYITNIRIVNLPVEEVLFFFVVPYCCTFIYECIRCYFPNIQSTKTAQNILYGLAITMLGIAIMFNHLYYTFYTAIFLAAFIFIVSMFKQAFASFNNTAFLIAYAIIIIPFMVVNGFLTAIPVVLYNNAENLGIRITTIPIEDTFYGMLLVIWNIILYEKLLKRSQISY
ncbi:lycopene cyclase domain-containing protein [Ferruginibacter yonginensis]|uniref:Lycopene cyclase domain-containing protein n=1 Tax=Ferruginibacter yonginensis TaxID=1310416 RepID=A0ABV8QTG5_9BACT